MGLQLYGRARDNVFIPKCSAHIRPVGALGFAGICRRRGEAWDNRTHTIEEAYAFDWKRKAPASSSLVPRKLSWQFRSCA